MPTLPEFAWTEDELRSKFSSLDSRRDVARILAVPVSWMTNVLYREGPETFYVHFEIGKKSGGSRTIHAPTSSLYILQSRLNRVLQAVYTPRPSVQGFVRERSVVTNASPHVGKRWVFNVDLRQFFPSLNFGRVRGMFMSAPFNCGAEAATLLAKLACLNNGLPIGGPASPVIANMICMRLDGELTRLAAQHNCWYTRYADDLTFSTRTPRFPSEVGSRDPESGLAVAGQELEAAVLGNGFEINEAKTRLYGRSVRQVVTGVTVNERTNVDRRFVRNIRAMIHSLEQDGFDGAQRKLDRIYTKSRHGHAAPAFADVLNGKLAYLSMVRGNEDDLVKRLRRQVVNLSQGRPRLDGLMRSLPPGDAVIRIAHLSDFHFKHEWGWDIDSVVEGLSSALADGAGIDLILVTGDIAYSAERSQYELARSFFVERLLPRLGLPPDRVLFVPGNHDVDRQSVGPAAKATQIQLLAEDDPDSYIAAVLRSEPDRRSLLARFDPYLDFVAQVSGDHGSPTPWWAAAVNIRGVHVQIAGLCSPLVSHEDRERGRLFLGQPQVNEVTKQSGDLNLALMHHPFEYLADTDDPARATVEGWADIVFHGHKHGEESASVRMATREVVILGAASSYQGSRWVNGFYVLDVDVTARTCAVTAYRRPAGEPRWIVSGDVFHDAEDGRFRADLPPR